MYETACVVNIGCRCHGDTKGTGCAILLDTIRGLVLAHGSSLAPFLRRTSHLSLSQTGQIVASDTSVFHCEVLLSKTPFKRAQSSMSEKTFKHSDLQTFKTAVAEVSQKSRMIKHALKSKESFHQYTKFDAVMRDVFQCSVVQRALSGLMPPPSWELVDRRDTKTAISNHHHPDTEEHVGPELEEKAQQLLSCFILLELQNWLKHDSVLVVQPSCLCEQGDPVEICSTPFGGLKPEAFMNSYSRGIISNLAGEDNCLLLSDARCILGGEGAPLYTFQNGVQAERHLTGIVIASLCWKNDEWVGFSVSCALDKVLNSLPSHFSDVMSNIRWFSENLGEINFSSGVLCLSPEVVLLKVGQTWGSGVVIDEAGGLVLTCSHVIKDAHRFPVQMKVAKVSVLLETDIIYRQQLVQHQFDLAVVQCTDVHYLTSHFNHSLSISRPNIGQEVYVIGHALFGSEHDLHPSVSSGVISKVISVSNIPIMIQTTCAVHAGASGGALVDRDGRLLGIVVCNARDNTSGASFPHINMSIPVCTVWPLIAKYQHTGDVRYLAALELRNKEIDNIWSLGQASSASGCSHPMTTSKL